MANLRLIVIFLIIKFVKIDEKRKNITTLFRLKFDK